MIVECAAPCDGWIVPLKEVDDPVFSGRMLGDGIAIDPLGDRIVAPVAGRIVTLHPAGHALSIRSEDGFELLIHVGLDTVELHGDGFTPLVAAGEAVTAGQPLIALDLDRLARRARSLVTPVIVTGEPPRRVVDQASGAIAAGALLFRVEIDGTAGPADGEVQGQAMRGRVNAALPHGLHVRPAARLSARLKDLDASATLITASGRANAGSPTALMALGIERGTPVEIEARGPDAAAALSRLSDFLAGGWEEEKDHAAAASDGGFALPPGAMPGIAAVPGAAIGPVALVEPAPVVIDEGPADVAAFDGALAQVRSALATPGGSADVQAIREGHRALLDDPELVVPVRAAIARGTGAARAWREGVEARAAMLGASSNRRIAERVADLRDVELQVLRALAGEKGPPASVPPGSVVVAEDLLPSQLIAFAESRPAALVTAGGSTTSHAAILAAGMGLPMLVAAGSGVLAAKAGAIALVDAAHGYVRFGLEGAPLAEAEAVVEAAAREAAAGAARAGEEARTADGIRIEVFANLGRPDDAAAAVTAGAEGCGLLRTEFLFLDRALAPDEAEQRAAYQAVADALGSRPLIIRLMDLGSDKPAAFLPPAQEANPALGVRGIRLALARPELLETQVRAILGVQGASVRIMAPMIATVVEMRAVRACVERVRGEKGAAPVQVGAMIETPAAAMTADLLADEADFFSIGTNDLAQYVLGMDRGEPALAAQLDAFHPAVLRTIERAVAGAAVRGRPVGVCGGLASDPLAAALLIGLGVSELSAAPAAIGAVKAVVRGARLAAARDLARACLACADAAAVRELCRRFSKGEAA